MWRRNKHCKRTKNVKYSIKDDSWKDITHVARIQYHLTWDWLQCGTTVVHRNERMKGNMKVEKVLEDGD